MPPPAPLWRRPRTQLYALTAVVWVLVAAVLFAASDALLPFILAALAAYVIDPLIARLERLRTRGRSLPRWGAVVVVYLFLAAGLYVLAVSIVPQIYREAVRGLLELREFLAGLGPDKIEAWARSIDAFMQRYGIPVDVLPGEGARTGARLHVDLAAGLADTLREASAAARGRLGDVVALSRSLLAGTVKTIFFFVLLFMLTAFISMDAPRIVRFTESLVPASGRTDLRRLLHGDRHRARRRRARPVHDHAPQRGAHARRACSCCGSPSRSRSPRWPRSSTSCRSSGRSSPPCRSCSSPSPRAG